MKICELNESLPKDHGAATKLKQLKNFILKNCQPYLEHLGPIDSTSVLYRGIKTSSKTAFVSRVRKDRVPKDTPDSMHKLMNQAMINVGFKTNRQNSIFCSSNKMMAGTYSTTRSIKGKTDNNLLSLVYAIYPLGEFNFAYSNTITDFFSFVYEEDGITYLLRNGYAKIVSSQWKNKIQVFDHYLEMLNERDTSYKDNYVAKHGPLPTDSDASVEMTLIDFTGCITGYGVGSKESELNERLFSEFSGMIIADFDLDIDYHNLDDFVKNNYTDQNLNNVLGRQNEVMISCDKVLYVRHDYNDLLLRELAA